jgi:hypothetical protein
MTGVIRVRMNAGPVSVRVASCRDHLAFRVLTPCPASAWKSPATQSPCGSPASRLAASGRQRGPGRVRRQHVRRNEASLRIAEPTARRTKIASPRLFENMNCHGAEAHRGIVGTKQDAPRCGARRPSSERRSEPGACGRADRHMASRRCQRHRSAVGWYAFDAAGTGAPSRATAMPARLVERSWRHARRGHRTEWRGSICRAIRSRCQSPLEPV